MDWKKQAIDDLRKLNRWKNSLDTLPDRRKALEYQKTTIKSSVRGSIPVQGGTSTYEDGIINLIVEQERIDLNMMAVKILVDAVERGLAMLDAQERRVLELFFIDRQHGHVERLMKELGYEERNVYKLKDRALYNLTISMYGLVDF